MRGWKQQPAPGFARHWQNWNSSGQPWSIFPCPPPSWPFPLTTSWHRRRHPPTSPASTVCATATAARRRKTCWICTPALARKVLATRSSAASWWAPTPCRPGTMTPTTRRRSRYVASSAMTSLPASTRLMLSPGQPRRGRLSPLEPSPTIRWQCTSRMCTPWRSTWPGCQASASRRASWAVAPWVCSGSAGTSTRHDCSMWPTSSSRLPTGTSSGRQTLRRLRHGLGNRHRA